MKHFSSGHSAKSREAAFRQKADRLFLAATTHKGLLSILLLLLTINSSFASWQPLGSGLPGKVNALVTHNGELYAGGDFPGLVSKWDGTNWVAVGAGLNGTSVRALISFNGELYAGGMINFIANSGNIAKWDGTNWIPVGDGLGGVVGSEVRCMLVFNGVLHAGGTFTMSGMNAVAKIGKLVGQSWQQVGNGTPPSCSTGVNAMTVYNMQLYVGGEGAPPFVNELDFTVSQWNAMPNGIVSGTGIYALATFKYPNQSTPSIFIGGDFDWPFSNCCTFSNGFWGTALNTFSSDAGDRVSALFSTTTSLYAGGVFSVQGATNLAKKPITGPWMPMGVTVDGSVDAFANYNDFLVCGGDFIHGDSTTMNHVMINYGVIISANDLSEKSSPDFFPNPAHTTLHFSHEGKTRVTIYDVAGKEVLEKDIENACDIDVRNLESGMYFYYVSEKGIKIGEGKIILE